MLPYLRQYFPEFCRIVEMNRRWISERRFLHALNYGMVLPGPEAQQLATYIGWLMHRIWGAIVATAAVLGYIGGRVSPGQFGAGGSHGQSGESFGPAR